MALETYLDQPPTDGITNLEFSPVDDTLAASSWAKTLSLYSPKENKRLATFTDHGAILDFTYSEDGSKLFHGGLSLQVIQTDIETGQILVLGKHSEGIKCISKTSDRVFSGSWDKTVKVWDVRSEDYDTLNQQDKVFSMDIVGHTLVVALAGRMINVYDTRNLKTVLEERMSSLKHMIRKVVLNPDASGFCTASVEGRICVEYFTSEQQRFSFKCHRQKVDDLNKVGEKEYVYPVNAIAYHPIHTNSIASGGSDGVVCIWDASLKKRLRQFPAYTNGISSACFNRSGNLLAIASSYTFEQGEKDHPADAIIVKSITDADVTPKSKPK